MRKAVSIRRAIVVPFVVLVMALSALLSYFSITKERFFIARYEKELTESLGERIEAHLRSFFAIPEVIVQNNLEVVNSGDLHLDDWRQLVTRFVGQIRHTPYLTYVSAGLKNGSYVGAHRHLYTNEVQLFMALPSEGHTFNRYAVHPNNTRAELLEVGRPFDSRTRAWYRNTVASGLLTWYPPYKYHAYPSLGVGVGVPIYDSQKQLLGVFTADLALSQLNDFLLTLRVGRGGSAFLCTPQGELVASSSRDTLYKSEGDSLRLRLLSESHNPLLRQVADLFHSGTIAGQHRLEWNGVRYLVHLQHYRSLLGLEMVIGIVIPERMYLQDIQTESKRVLIFMSVSVLFCVLLGLWLARRVAGPIERLQKQADLLASRRWQATEPLDTGVQELNDLEVRFNSMAHELTSNLAVLEERVAQRTQSLEQTNSELKELNAVKDKFFSIVSHDLKNPFLSLVGVSELVIEDLKNKNYDDALQSAQVVMQCAQSGYKLLLNLLEWSRSQSGAIDIHLESLNVGFELNETLDLFQVSLAEKQQTLVNEVDGQHVVTDRHVLQTVMRNLVANAIKYTPPQGQIHIYAEERVGQLWLHVSDTGVGIPEADLQKLFRVDSMFSTLGTENEKGTGLGLILCKELLRKVNGDLQVKSQEGTGSTFSLVLPLG